MLGKGLYVTCFLRFASGATPADLLVASMAAEQVLVGLKTRVYCAAAHSVGPGR